MPKGMRNILATQCSRPKATKPVMGKKTAMALAPISGVDVAIHTAMQTSQLHRIPLTSTAEKLAEHLAVAIATADAPTPVDAIKANAASSNEPTRFALVTVSQFLQTLQSLTLPSSHAAVQSAKLPVTNSPPAVTVISSPIGRPNMPSKTLCKPGSVALIPGTDPPTETAKNAPRAMCAPLAMPIANILFKGRLVLAVPSFTALSYNPAGPGRGSSVCILGVPAR
mmetsp:Transcript_145383/g.264580  ORF Transcript_145383/g.264580 Transcript_145383/m.264580 type:complete len:225 (+) Transcript_145383:340-1014(+)